MRIQTRCTMYDAHGNNLSTRNKSLHLIFYTKSLMFMKFNDNEKIANIMKHKTRNSKSRQNHNRHKYTMSITSILKS